jgi:hypothetical protein
MIDSSKGRPRTTSPRGMYARVSNRDIHSLVYIIALPFPPVVALSPKPTIREAEAGLGNPACASRVRREGRTNDAQLEAKKKKKRVKFLRVCRHLPFITHTLFSFPPPSG